MVSLVTSEEVENRSIVVNKKVWMLWNMSRRRFFAKPHAARAQVKPAAAPKASEASAMSASTPPADTTCERSAPALMTFTRSAILNGISTSNTTSPRTSSGVTSDAARYSPMLPMSLRMTCM